MSNLPLDPAILIFTIALVVTLLLYLREYNLRRKLESETGEFLQNIREKGWETLHQSIKKSEEVVGEAELESIKVVAASRLETKKFEEDFSKQLTEALNESKQNIAAAQAQLLGFMKDLQKRSGEFEEAQKKSGEARINKLFDGIETKLADFLVQISQKTTSSIELELKASRQLIDTYKAQQLKLIDENIIAMMEQTLGIVLAKKLSLKDQLDLIYEALEKAKIEKFIV